MKIFITSGRKIFFNTNARALAAAMMFICSVAVSQTFPSGFNHVKIATIYYPTSMAMAPDGRIFCTEKDGKVKIVKNGVKLGQSFVTVNVNQQDERGLGAIALDPDFNNNHYVYLYYTADNPVHNRLSRFTANGDVAVPGSEVILKDFPNSLGTIHNGGGMAFGPDGKLYICIGNDNVNSYSQDINNYKGKVLRVNKDFSVPSGNPFSGSEAADRVWAYGLRNPWSIAVQPGTGKIYIIDVGEGAWEEVNDVTTGGKNFGWPAAEGNSSNPAFTNPVYAYPHGNGNSAGCAITGGDFFNPSSTNYPQQYQGKYFFIDYCNDWINYLDISGNPTKHDFASNLPGSGNYLKVGTDGNIYYYSIGQNGLYKIVYNSSSAPTIVSQPPSITVSEGLNATFNVSASGAQPLSYQWQKNAQDIPGANGQALQITNVQYSDAGQYRVKVTNSFGSVTSNSGTLTVTAFNAQPVGNIITPAQGASYRGGDVISFSGNGTDGEDGTLPASAFSWYVDFHHDAHIHPGPVVPQSTKTGTFQIPNFGEKSANVWYRLYMIVSDSQGAKDTVYRDIWPVKSKITIQTQPAGMGVLFNDQPESATFTANVVSGVLHGIGVITPQPFHDTEYVFEKWIHGGSPSQTFTTSDDDKTFTAVYKTTGKNVAGLKDQRPAKELIDIFPNPADGRFTFDICEPGKGEQELAFSMYDLTGQEVLRGNRRLENGCLRETIETGGDLPAGLYLLKLNVGGKTAVAKVILENTR